MKTFRVQDNPKGLQSVMCWRSVWLDFLYSPFYTPCVIGAGLCQGSRSFCRGCPWIVCRSMSWATNFESRLDRKQSLSRIIQT